MRRLPSSESTLVFVASGDDEEGLGGDPDSALATLACGGDFGVAPASLLLHPGSLFGLLASSATAVFDGRCDSLLHWAAASVERYEVKLDDGLICCSRTLSLLVETFDHCGQESEFNNHIQKFIKYP
jgi:hypothetical protein